MVRVVRILKHGAAEADAADVGFERAETREIEIAARDNAGSLALLNRQLRRAIAQVERRGQSGDGVGKIAGHADIARRAHDEIAVGDVEC